MAAKSKSANQIYFTKDHEMVRRAVSDFVKKEINPIEGGWYLIWGEYSGNAREDEEAFQFKQFSDKLGFSSDFYDVSFFLFLRCRIGQILSYRSMAILCS